MKKKGEKKLYFTKLVLQSIMKLYLQGKITITDFASSLLISKEYAKWIIKNNDNL